MPELHLLICPGIHSPELTDAFVAAISPGLEAHLAVHWRTLPPTIPPYAPEAIAPYFESHWQALDRCPASAPTPLTVVIGFSAGVVGAIATARRWHRQGRPIAALIAFDGWGVPLAGAFPIYRFSHDRFTAQTSEWPQPSQGYFYADPPVEHLALWRSPQTSHGYYHSPQPRVLRLSAQATLQQILLNLTPVHLD